MRKKKNYYKKEQLLRSICSKASYGTVYDRPPLLSSYHCSNVNYLFLRTDGEFLPLAYSLFKTRGGGGDSMQIARWCSLLRLQELRVEKPWYVLDYIPVVASIIMNGDDLTKTVETCLLSRLVSTSLLRRLSDTCLQRLHSSVRLEKGNTGQTNNSQVNWIVFDGP